MEPTTQPTIDTLPPEPARAGPFLASQLRWIVTLRWIAGTTVILGGMADMFYLHLYDRIDDRGIAAVGVAILAYNVLFWHLSRKPIPADTPHPRRRLDNAYGQVWGQIFADLACLTLLVIWTDGYASPLRAFFVFHMVFASLMLPRSMAFGVALVTIGMVEGMLAAVMPASFTRTTQEIAVSFGWDLTLLATVYLASRVARDLARQRRRLARQNLRIRRMSARLSLQERAMAQHEKMVALGQMAAGVAHEVANPLASMDGLMQLMERRPDKITPENFARLREQIARINLIVRQLITFARPAADAGDDAPWIDTSLNDVVLRSLEVLRFDNRLKNITIERHLDPKLPILRMQPTALEQVIVNLVINAADALEASAAPKLTLTTQARNGAIELQVQDNGHGMSDDVRARIFEPFFTTKAVGKGTGLGLSISYSLVKKHGGEIQVASTPGQGTTFTVCLPFPVRS